MRVSTSQIFEQGTLGMQRNQVNLLKTQGSIASGRRIATPEDDPVAASQVLVLTQSKEINRRFIENQGAAADRLKLTETRLGNAVDALQEILPKVIQAGNLSLNDANRAAIATELQNRRDELLAIANAQDGSGDYMFSGFKTSTKPFVASGNSGPYNAANPYVSYQGDAGVRELEVDASRRMATGETGSEVFLNIRDSDGRVMSASVFDALQNVIDALSTPIAANPTFQATYDTSLNQLSASIDSIQRSRSSVGARLAELDSLSSAASDIGNQFEATISSLQDLDYAQAISTLTLQQVQLESAQRSFLQISSLSLFKLL